MDKLKEILQNVWLKVVSALKNFENSAIFERIMRRYESLSPNGQSAFKGVLKIVVMLVLAFMILGGPFMLLSKLNEIQQLEKLEGEALTFKAEYEAATRGYEPPMGWRPLAAASADELSRAFNEYLPGIGVPEEFGTLMANGDTLNLTLREISIRQATNIIFQLEGLYPKVKTQTLKVRPNAGQRDILDMEATFKFNAAFANQFSGMSPPPDMGPSEDDFAPSGDLPPPPSNNRRNTPNLPDTSGGDDINNEYIPPPPPPSGGDYDELAPPELPDDLPPPPPPPGFEEEP